MALEFAVAPVSAVFETGRASVIGREIKRIFGVDVVTPVSEPYYSEQLPWSGCEDLCILAESELGGKQPQLEISKELQVVYLPTTAAPLQISYNSAEPPLYCGSLALLRDELNTFASVRGLPIDLAQIDAYWQRSDFEEDEGYDIETYCHLQLAVYQAICRRLPLWEVR